METNNSKWRESKKQKNNETTNAYSSKDIRAFFEKHRTVSCTEKVDVPKNVVELSDKEWMQTDLTFNIIFFLRFSYFQYLLFVKVEKRNKNKQKIGLVEFFAGLIFANAYVGKILQD